MATEWTAAPTASHVARVGYDDDAGELLVEFKSGALYAYPGQDRSAYDDLAVHPSPGSYVSRWLRTATSRKVS